MIMELHQLRYVVEVARLGSFTAAANTLHISQSGVSAQVAKLERELGVTLFDRSWRTPRLTPEGWTMVPTMQAVLAGVDDLERVSDELVGLVRGSVQIGTLIGCTIPGFLDGFAEFRTDHSGVRATLVEDDSDALIARLLSGELDVILLAHCEPLPSTITSVTFVDEVIAVGVPENHPWCGIDALDIHELADADLITLASGTGIRAALDQMSVAEKCAIRPAIEAHSPDTVLALAARGVGVAVLSDSMINSPLVAVPLRNAEHASLSIAVRPTPGPAARALFGILRRNLAAAS